MDLRINLRQNIHRVLLMNLRSYFLFVLALMVRFPAVVAQQQTPVPLQQQVNQARQASKAQAYLLFSPTSTVSYNAGVFQPDQKPVTLRIDPNVLGQITDERPDLLEFTIPSGSTAIELELVPIDLFSPSGKILIGNGNRTLESPMNRGLFYQGFIKNKPASLVSISIVDGELNGFVADETGTRSISRLARSPGNYLFYADNTISKKQPFTCLTDNTSPTSPALNQSPIAPEAISCKVVGIYLEADYQTYLSSGSSITATTSFIMNLFNQVATIYNRENIAIRISGIKVWTSSDPYASATSTGDALDAFRNYQNSNPPPGITSQLSHLLSTRGLGGGQAYLDVLCNPFFKYGVSANLSTTYPEFPNYSWEVMVVAHELGHNFGSPHTQSCTWPGGAIDNCYTTEGSCPPGPAPTNGGTIMSYCHNTGYGINLANGFGQLPGNLMRSRVTTSSCVPSAADPPVSLATRNISATGATVYWVSNSGSTSFLVQYRPASSSTWTTVGPFTGPRRTLTDLQPNTTYVWRVTGECSGAYSAEATFTSGQAIYCAPLYSNDGCPFSIGIKQVVVNNTALSVNTGCSPSYFTFYPGTPGRVSKTTANTFIVDFINYFNPQHLTIWIDFNENYDFEASELVYATSQQFIAPVSASFVIPGTATGGVTRRMRIRNQYFSPITDPCNTLSYGETEDYLVYIEPDCAPPPTINLSASTASCLQSTTLSVTNCTGTVSWLPSGSGNTLVVNPTQTTSYTATCTTTGGCRVSRTTTLVVLPDMVTVRSGNWSDPSVWSCNQVPSAVTPVTIRTGHRVTMPVDYTGSARSLLLQGNLNFQTGARLNVIPTTINLSRTN